MSEAYEVVIKCVSEADMGYVFAEAMEKFDAHEVVWRKTNPDAHPE